MSLQRPITPARELEEEVRQHVIEVRDYLVTCGYREGVVFEEARNGLISVPCGSWTMCRLEGAANYQLAPRTNWFRVI